MFFNMSGIFFLEEFKFNGFTKDLRNNFAKQTQGAQTKSSAQMFFQHVLHIFLELFKFNGLTKVLRHNCVKQIQSVQTKSFWHK